MNECLLTLIATLEFEERLVDWLLEAHFAGFTTAPCYGHGVHPDRLSRAEQVAGQQRRTAFWLQLSQQQAESIVQGLAEHFGDAGLHFWITPVLAAGPIVTPQSGDS